MSLSPEDSLRLNVLLRQDLQAVRIDESKMTVFALTEKGEAKVPLNPTGKDEAYLREVRQLFSTHVLSSPGGYPVYLKRWTRMGQERSDTSLKQLLLLGENEAVVAVVHAPGLTNELARRAWWITPNSENARRMLEKEDVVTGAMGPTLADFLVEFLSFEEDQQAMIDSVQLVLQPGLISAEQQQKLWDRGQRRTSFYIGFLKALPDNLPGQTTKHPEHDAVQIQLLPFLEQKNPVAEQLCRVLCPNGQAFLKTTRKVIEKLNNQDAAVALVEAIENYFEPLRPDTKRQREINKIVSDADACCHDNLDCSEILRVDSAHHDKVKAMLILSMVSEQLLAPVFGQTDAIGSVMRKKLSRITTTMLEQLSLLQQ